jgi:hypothetical protein
VRWASVVLGFLKNSLLALCKTIKGESEEGAFIHFEQLDPDHGLVLRHIGWGVRGASTEAQKGSLGSCDPREFNEPVRGRNGRGVARMW